MGKAKAGFLTPKAIANRIKAKGLQKLRWYCQMCQKQCRDENGFKCHTMAESHQRQLLLFAENPDTYIDEFSKDFEDGYLELLRRRFGTKRVQCNIVYQEYIAFKEHVHMNSTQWETLTDFVKHLGKTCKCTVDSTEKGWFVQYIDRNPEAIRKQEALVAKEKLSLDDEERQARVIQKQIERASELGHSVETEYTELQRDNDEEKVTFGLSTKKSSTEMPKPSTTTTNALLELKRKQKALKTHDDDRLSKVGQKRKSALDEIMLMEEKDKEKINRKDYWLHEGIIVKIVTKKLGDEYYKKKALVKEVKDQFTGILKVLDTGSTIKVDQSHVETVIPALGKAVLICNGAYRGYEALLTKLHEKAFSCSVTIKSGLQKGRVVESIQYEDISKLYTPD